MRPLLALLVVAALSQAATAQDRPPLRLIRTAPAGDASPLSVISVTFDRPVAGSLDRSIDPAQVIRVEPAVQGRFEWRDPVTVRFIPSAPLRPNVRYTVTVSSVQAMDGSRLPDPARFEFRVQGPVLIGALPLDGERTQEHLVADQRFDLVYSAAVDLQRLAGAAYIQMSNACPGTRMIRLRANGQRAINRDDIWQFREAGGWQRDRSLDSIRRVVQVSPETPLPLGCAGELVIPTEVADGLPRGLTRRAFRTYGEFRIVHSACGHGSYCPTGPASVTFSTPVSGAVVQRLVKLLPETPFVVRDTMSAQTTWTLEAPLVPNRSYAIVVDSSARDSFGQRLIGNPAVGLRATGYAPSVHYAFGRHLIERKGFRTLAVQHVNVDTIVALVAPVPDSLEARFLSRFGWGATDAWDRVASSAGIVRIPVTAGRDKPSITGVLLPASDASRAGTPTLFAVRVLPTVQDSLANRDGRGSAIAVVQVTDLGVTARIGPDDGMVWVTGVSDGLPRAGARVTLHGPTGRAVAAGQTDARGLARLGPFARTSADTAPDGGWNPLEGYVSATLGDDRALVAIHEYDPDLSPWRFGVSPAYGGDRFALAGAVFTERGIYRPGESVHVKAIVRTGSLGSLVPPAVGDSLRWVFTDREGQVVGDTTVALSPFGTAARTITVPASAQVGYHGVRIEMRRQGAWQSIGWTNYRVAEYRPPEFLVDVTARELPVVPGDRFDVGVAARYLFGAPMGHSPVSWTARQQPVGAWALGIPGTDGWQVGDAGWWWEDDAGDSGPRLFANGTDTLDARGEGTISVVSPAATQRATRLTIEAMVTDVNRQTVATNTSAIVHPAAFYIAARQQGKSWFWREREAQAIAVRAVRPDGSAEPNVRVRGALVRREWHRVRRERNGIAQLIGEWVSDTVARCVVTTTSAEPPTCSLAPRGGGMHMVVLEATDAAGRRAVTTFGRWVAGSGFVPWSDATQFTMQVVTDRDRYSVGDTATVMLASPFTDAEAWVTVEREGIIEQRRMRLTSGATTLTLPITEAYAPNAFVSVVVTRGRSAPPGPIDDPGRPTMRVGYAEIRVTPEVKRLDVRVEPLAPEFRPGDTARVRLTVRDARGAPARSEITVWAVDEGVLALTGYKTPDPIDLIYRERGLAMRLASNLVAVAPQIPEGEKGRREAGGGGGSESADILRSRFRTTAFFLGSVVTDAAGVAVISGALPENLTTFRVMAVAVTAGDRYGSGASPLLVTRPLVARPALPRFTRPGDEFLAGTVVNRRDGTVARVAVRATARGIRLTAAADQTVTLASGRGAEARFRFRTSPGDSATFRFDARSGSDADAVQLSIPIRPDFHPRAYTVAGVLRDTATAEFVLPDDIDPARSRLSLNLGSSPLAIIGGIRRETRVYPYYCTEQVASVATPLIALMRAEAATPGAGSGSARVEVERAVGILLRRQREDGGIGYWSAGDWTTPWLSAHAAQILADARSLGIAVDSVAMKRLADYLRGTLRGQDRPPVTPVIRWYERREMRLADQVAAVDALSRLGAPDIGAENELLRTTAQMAREDRIRLADVLHRRGAVAAARELLGGVWSEVRVEGRRAVLAPVQSEMYFHSELREDARLLMATLAIAPDHPLVGPLVETVVQRGRSQGRLFWNTQDFAFVVQALAEFERHRRTAGPGLAIRARAGNRVLLRAGAGAAPGDTSVSLDGLLGPARNGERPLRITLDADGRSDVPAFYYLTVTEVPRTPPVRPSESGIRVERWYERFDNGQPVTSIAEGELVRVRLRVTISADRQFVVLDDPLPAGLEAIDLSLRTASLQPGPGSQAPEPSTDRGAANDASPWGYGRWDSGWWTPWDHSEIRDDRVVYAATVLWPGTHTATYVARATTPGVFVRPPAHAEEMYNPAVQGRSDGGTFTVTERPPR